MKTLTLTLASLSAAALVASSASASITAVSGQTILLGTGPASCTPGSLAGINAYAWDEQQGVALTNQVVNMVNNPGTSASPTPGTLTGVYDSHFLHWEAIPGIIFASGTVTFSAPIDGVIFRTLDLDNTDVPLGFQTTTYPTGFPFRDIGSSGSMFSINANVLTFNFQISPVMGVTELRVLTQHVPAPGAVMVAGLAGAATLRRKRR
ncbi:MAG: hypothetical protein JNK58_04935 [Phycisphaerae bacterium]|nr:hypothetical protein [Phycisphaerae bacterium]